MKKEDYLTLVEIYNESEKIDCNSNEAIGSLKSLLQRYRDVSKKYPDLKEIPLLNENTDVDMFYTCLCGDGPKKLTDLKIQIKVIMRKYAEKNRPIEKKEEMKDKNHTSCLKKFFKYSFSFFGIAFSGFALHLCNSNDGETSAIIDSSINDQNGSVNQSPQINIYGNNNVVSNSGIVSNEVDNNAKESNAGVMNDSTVQKYSDSTLLKNGLSKKSSYEIETKRKFIENEVCVLYKDAIVINPSEFHVAGKLESVLDGYNSIAKKIEKDIVKKCDRIDNGIGTITECGRKQLETVIRNLKIYAINNDLSCAKDK